MTRSNLNQAQREEATYQLRNCALFASINELDFSRLLDGVTFVSLEEGETLFVQDKEAIAFYVLQAGQVKLVRLSSAGNEKVVELISPGESFAEAVMFSHSTYPVSAVALRDTHVWCIRTDDYREILKQSFDACFAVMAELSRRLHQQLGEIDYLTLHNATARLVAFLLDHAEKVDDNQAIVELQFTKVVLASRLSVTPETLSRTFTKLGKEDLISIDERHIALLDINRLKQLQMSE